MLCQFVILYSKDPSESIKSSGTYFIRRFDLGPWSGAKYSCIVFKYFHSGDYVAPLSDPVHHVECKNRGNFKGYMNEWYGDYLEVCPVGT